MQAEVTKGAFVRFSLGGCGTELAGTVTSLTTDAHGEPCAWIDIAGFGGTWKHREAVQYLTVERPAQEQGGAAVSRRTYCTGFRSAEDYNSCCHQHDRAYGVVGVRKADGTLMTRPKTIAGLPRSQALRLRRELEYYGYKPPAADETPAEYAAKVGAALTAYVHLMADSICRAKQDGDEDARALLRSELGTDWGDSPLWSIRAAEEAARMRYARSPEEVLELCRDVWVETERPAQEQGGLQ